MTNILNKKRNLLHFSGPWEASFGCPELTGTWIVWGGSGSGKTTFAMQLAKYLSSFARVMYNSLEEGDSESIRQAFLRTGMAEVGSRLWFLDMEPIETMLDRLRKRKAPRIVIIDSIQYAQLTYQQYTAIREEFRDTLFVYISHQDGKDPAGSTAQRIRYDAFVKVRVEGYRAHVASRYLPGEGEPFTIWPEGATKYWGI